MRFTARTDYSLRMLMVVAAKRPQKVTIQEITERLGLSQDHLMRIAADLSKHGFLTSSCGRGGGLVLRRNVDEITVGAVVRAMEPDFALVQCFTDDPDRCSLEPGCRLKGTLSTALRAFFAELDKATLADLVPPQNDALARLLGLTEIPVSPS